ncbi:Ankyrin [Plasmopara halstedii]|uniref:Ankyrin n=1 Tax=Plasmopara halstedii TaxID=4781 RepID=A0A0P1AWR6_PLAHL|nr:Ankyrin [Plasmopara halstedii]CEG46869.1 Ankyrin [Plasmopara halstedii]|eukprot:XP_024583238.1 Ankyrin [Plasmopara halstedii]
MRIFSRDTITDFVRRGDLVGVRRRLEKGDNVNERRSFNNTPLIEAARYNVVDILELLIAYGADLELTNSNDLTALHAAIDEKRSATAIALAQHGASANHVGLFGRTPLQCAVMRDLLDVTAVLLARGADPIVKSDSGKTAIEYVRTGPNSVEMEKLLTAYTNVEAAIGAMNADAITVCLRELLTGDRTADVSNIDAAIQLKHTEAVTILLQMSLASDTLVEMVDTYKIVEQGVKQTEDEIWRHELKNLAEDFGRGVLTLLMNSGDVELLKQLVEDTMGFDWIQNLRLSNGWTPLHLAASQTNFALVRYLLVECGSNPLVLSPGGRTAFDYAVELDKDSRVSYLLREHIKQRAFWERATLILGTSDVSMMKLRPLLSLMTSVYDLHIIFGLGFRTLSHTEMHALLSEAFDEVIRAKLVVDDQATVFFKLALRVCRRENFISEVEQLKWDLKATKVRGGSLVWDREIKRSLLTIACRFKKVDKNSLLLQKQYKLLRAGLHQRPTQGKIKSHTRQRYLSLLFVALILSGCSGYKDDFGVAYNPAKFLAMMSTDNVENFVAGIINAFNFKSEFEALLVHSAIDPMELVFVLRDIANLELPESVRIKISPWKLPDRVIIST